MVEALKRGPQWRNRVFTDPPRATEQIIHPETYPSKENVSSFTLTGQPPQGFERLECNHLGELGGAADPRGSPRRRPCLHGFPKAGMAMPMPSTVRAGKTGFFGKLCGKPPVMPMSL